MEHKLRCINLKAVLNRGRIYRAGLPKLMNFFAACSTKTACLHSKKIQVVVRGIKQKTQMFTSLADNSSSTSDSSEISEYFVATVNIFPIVSLIAFRYSKGVYMPIVNFTVDGALARAL